MKTALATPSIYTQLKKRLFTFARLLQGPAQPCELIATVIGHETIVRKSGLLKMTLSVHNRGPGHCLTGSTLKVDWIPERQPGRVVQSIEAKVAGQILRGQTETIEVHVPVPNFLGRFHLQARLPGLTPQPILTPIEVLARNEDDIDYVAVYKNTDLTQNDWHIVGPSTQAEHERLAKLKIDDLCAAGLTPDMAVFDVGCGTGQLALTLEKFLSKEGYYFGVDIGREGIEHCKKRFLRPNFEFDVNGMTTLPANRRAFDFITLFSVFTHTLADETMMLMHEMKPYLKPTGVVYCDFFFSDFIDRYSGNRGRIEFERAYWERMMTMVGYTWTVVNSWQVEPHTTREVFQLRRSK
jgi:ubiquinone/menaquinone biosynthesis C-methylase UbiE